MKKFLTLVLALVLALALAVPAMAFTSVTPDEDVVPELDIYLVEHEDDEFFGFAGAAPSDRGYAKNEIVAAIVELTVPDDYGTLNNADFVALVFDGDDVSLNVTENANATTASFKASTNVGTAVSYDSPLVASNKITLDISAGGFADDATYKWMFFAKVTGEDASLTATLDAAEEAWSATGTPADLEVGDYTVRDLGGEFLVLDGSVNQFSITVDDDDETVDLFIYDGATKYLAVNPEAGVFYLASSGARLTTSSTIRDLQAIYEDVFVEEFKFDFSISNGVLERDYFEDLNGSDDIEATVEIKPWTAYVTVPDNIVVDPPKTGDAASIVGFVMIVLAAAAVVAVKKVRA